MSRVLALVCGLLLIAFFVPYIMYPPTLDWLMRVSPFPAFFTVTVLVLLAIAAGVPLITLLLESVVEQTWPVSVVFIYGVIFAVCVLISAINLNSMGQLNQLEAIVNAYQRSLASAYALGGAFFLLEYWWDSRRS